MSPDYEAVRISVDCVRELAIAGHQNKLMVMVLSGKNVTHADVVTMENLDRVDLIGYPPYYIRN